VLEHEYSRAGLSFSALKNSDRTYTYALTTAAKIAEERAKVAATQARGKRKKGEEEESERGFE